MTRRPFAIVGFDLDGTLLDTSADLTAAVNHALAGIDCPPVAVDRIRPAVGLGVRRMLSIGLADFGTPSEADMDRLYHVVLDHYAAHIAVHTQPFPGVLDAMARLAEMDVALAICTNKFERLAIRLLDELGIADRFAAIIGGDTLGDKVKPDPAPIWEMIARCGDGPAAFVGDSINDVMAARNAGIPSVAVSFGFLMQPVASLNADAVIDHYDELLPTLDRLATIFGQTTPS